MIIRQMIMLIFIHELNWQWELDSNLLGQQSFGWWWIQPHCTLCRVENKLSYLGIWMLCLGASVRLSSLATFWYLLQSRQHLSQFLLSVCQLSSAREVNPEQCHDGVHYLQKEIWQPTLDWKTSSWLSMLFTDSGCDGTLMMDWAFRFFWKACSWLTITSK